MEPEPMTLKQEARMLSWIAKRVQRLSPAGRRWLVSWISSTLSSAPGGQ